MFLPCLLLPFALAQSAPPSARILGRNDLVFARELHDAGFDDMALKLCTAVTDAAKAGGGYTPDDVLEATILGFESETAEAATINELDARQKRLEDILARADVFAKTLPDGPKADRLNQSLASAHQLFAETLLALMQAEQANPAGDPVKIKNERTAADKFFAQAEDTLEKRVKLEEDMKSTAADDAALDAIDRKLIVDEYSLAGTYYRHSLLLIGNDVKRRVVLRQALDALGEFELDWGSELLAFNAYIYEGLCHKELGEDDKAIESFDYAIGLRDTFGQPGPDGVYKLPADAADVISLAVLQKVLFLGSQKNWAGAIATAQDFLKTTPDALKTQQGLAVVAALADAQQASGDFDGVRSSANLLIQADPHGSWGGQGNRILAEALKSGPVDASRPDLQLRVAETYSDNKDYQRAHAACRQARVLSAGSPAEADIGAESFVIDGTAYMRENRKAEACIAYDTAVTLYPKGAKAPDALWRSINGYLDLYSEEHRSFYKKLTDDRMARFVKDYPTNPNAVLVSLISGRQFETEGDFDRASQVYQGVAPTSPAYGEAQYHAGICLLRQADALHDVNKLTEEDACRKKAQPILETARKALEKQLADTIEPEQHQRLAGLAFNTRTTLAQLLLRGSPADAAKVMPLLADVETTFAGDPDKIARAWSLRISSLVSQNKLQEAVDMLDNLVQKSPDATSVGNAAGVLARALDRAAADLLAKDPASRKADETLHNAARLYALSVKGQVTGKEAVTTTLLEPVGERLFALGLTFEQAPAGSDSFLDWTPTRLTQPELWDQIAAIFEAILGSGPNSKADLFLGRVRGLQARWKEAALAYSKLFELEPIVVPGNPHFDVARLQTRPELRNAYVEWGMAETMAGSEGGDKERLARASDIYEKSLGSNNLETGSQLWWRAKCLQVQTMVARGQYDVADITLRNIERTTQDYDQNKYGAKTRLLALKAEVAKRIPH